VETDGAHREEWDPLSSEGSLLRAETPAAEVALASGFAHQSHMARCMRRVLGVNPTQLRA